MPRAGLVAPSAPPSQPVRDRELAAARQQKLQHQQAHLQQEARERQREALEQTRLRAQAKSRGRNKAIKYESDLPLAPTRGASSISTFGQATRARFRDHSTLRELIVLRELLDPPVAMREPKQFPYGE
jgi:hypothetical protein